MVQRFNFALRACRYAHTHTRKSDKANGDELTHTRRKKTRTRRRAKEANDVSIFIILKSAQKEHDACERRACKKMKENTKITHTDKLD